MTMISEVCVAHQHSKSHRHSLKTSKKRMGCPFPMFKYPQPARP